MEKKTRLKRCAQAIFALCTLGAGALGYGVNFSFMGGLWPDGVVYFKFVESQGYDYEYRKKTYPVGNDFRQLYLEAMKKIQQESKEAVIFVQLNHEDKVTDKPYVLEISDVLSGPHGEGGASTVGANSQMNQLLVMSQAYEAFHPNTARHELMHVLGFSHGSGVGSCKFWGQDQAYISAIRKRYAGEQAKRQNRQKLIRQSVVGAGYSSSDEEEQTADGSFKPPASNKTDLFIKVAGENLCLEAEARFSWWLQDKQQKERLVKVKTCEKGKTLQQWKMNADKKVVNVAYPDLCLGRVIDTSIARAGFIGLTYCKEAPEWRVSADGTQLLDSKESSLMLTYDKEDKEAVLLWQPNEQNGSTWTFPFDMPKTGLSARPIDTPNQQRGYSSNTCPRYVCPQYSCPGQRCPY